MAGRYPARVIRCRDTDCGADYATYQTKTAFRKAYNLEGWRRVNGEYVCPRHRKKDERPLCPLCACRCSITPTGKIRLHLNFKGEICERSRTTASPAHQV